MQLRKSDCLGCAVLLCLVCLFDLACFLLPSSSHLSLNCIQAEQYCVLLHVLLASFPGPPYVVTLDL